MKTIGREILWNLPHAAAIIMYALFGVVLLVIAWGVYRRVEAYRLGRTERENRFDDLRGRLWDTVRLALGQQRVLHRKFGGLVHLCIFSAFIVLFIVTCLVAVEYDLGFRILDGNFYIVFKLFAETFGAVLLLGVAGALVRRIVFRPPGLTKENDDTLQLLLIGAIGVTGFLIETARIAATHPAIAPISFVSNALAPALFGGMPLSEILSVHKALWWTHLLIAFGFLASLPFTKMIHMGTGTASVFLRTSRPKGALQPIPNIEEEENPGVAAVTDFSWKQLLSADGCTKCGRCQDECPAFAAEMPLSPRDVVLKTKDQLGLDLYGSLVPSATNVDKATGKRVVPDFVREVLTPGEIWACTTCRACMQACPVMIEHIDMIVDVRRGYVAASKVPDTVKTALRKMGDTGNPWGLPQDDRIAWAEGLDVPFAAEKKEFEYLYWVGCAGAYDPRNQKVTRAIVSLLNRAGVSYATLGLEEMCCGESARRMGEEGLFQLGMVEMVKEVFAGVQGEEGHHAVPPLLQHLPERVPPVRGERRGRPPLRPAPRPDRPGKALPPEGEQRGARLPRLVLSRPAQRHLRRPPGGPCRHPRRRDQRDGEESRGRVLLRRRRAGGCGWSPRESGSTTFASGRRWPRARTPSGRRAPTASSCSTTRSSTTISTIR